MEIENPGGKTRKFTYDDLERILEIEALSFPNSSDERFTLYDFHFYHRYYGKYFLVYQDNDTGKILGYIIFTPRGHIVSIAVDPLYREKGIGKKLILEVFRRSRKVWVEVEDHNNKAKKFYKSLGFREKRIVHNYYTSKESAMVMELQH